MSKFHINIHGVPAPCKAIKGKCPLGGESGDEGHFDNPRDAQAYADKIHEEEHSFLPGAPNGSVPGKFKYNSSQLEEFKGSNVSVEYDGKKFSGEVLSHHYDGDGSDGNGLIIQNEDGSVKHIKVSRITDMDSSDGYSQMGDSNRRRQVAQSVTFSVTNKNRKESGRVGTENEDKMLNAAESGDKEALKDVIRDSYSVATEEEIESASNDAIAMYGPKGSSETYGAARRRLFDSKMDSISKDFSSKHENPKVNSIDFSKDSMKAFNQVHDPSQETKEEAVSTYIQGYKNAHERQGLEVNMSDEEMKEDANIAFDYAKSQRKEKIVNGHGIYNYSDSMDKSSEVFGSLLSEKNKE